MAYELTSIDRIVKKSLTHSAQLTALEYISPLAKERVTFSILEGEQNSFLVGESDKGYLLVRPFETDIKDSINRAIEALPNLSKDVTLRGFPLEVMTRGEIIHAGGGADVHLLQEPLPAEEYARLLQQLSGTRYTTRLLGPDDVPALAQLGQRWKDAKIRRSTDPTDRRNLMVSLPTDEKELQKYYERMMSFHPSAAVYGAFDGERLFAMVATYGTGNIRIFHSRQNIRRNLDSPQEFLDLTVCLQFAREGVTTFDRGSISFSDIERTKSLLKYKSKFGKITGVIEFAGDVYWLNGKPVGTDKYQLRALHEQISAAQGRADAK